MAALALLWAWVVAQWPLVGAALLAGAVGGVVLLLWPLVGLSLLIVAIPFGSLRGLGLGTGGLGVADLLLVATVVAWLVRQVARRTLRLTWPPLVAAGLLLLAAMLFSLFPATSLLVALEELAKWIQLWLAAVLVLNMVDRRTVLPVVLALLAAGAAQGLLGVYQFVMRIGPPAFLLMGRFMRAAGTFGQPNPYAGYLGLTLPLALGLLLTTWPGRRGSIEQRRLRVIWLVAAATGAAMAAGLLASWSRGAWLGVMAASGAVVVARGGVWPRRVAVGSAVVVLVSLAVWGRLPIPVPLQERFLGYVAEFTLMDVRRVQVTPANWAVVERAAHWQAAWDMLRDHPWTGVGLGHYVVAYDRYALPAWPIPLGHAHNYYLNIAAEAGLPGLAAYLLWVAAGFWLALRAVNSSQGLWQGLALGVLGMWVHLSVHNLFDKLYVHSMGIQVGLMLGLAAWIVLAKPGPESP